MSDPVTHRLIDRSLCGTPVSIEPGSAEVVLVATPEMAVDQQGLVHGGFVFGLADHAAMLAVNDPNVVLESSEVHFIAPARVGDELRATATLTGEWANRREVEVSVRRGDAKVFSGMFLCFVLAQHVLDD